MLKTFIRSRLYYKKKALGRFRRRRKILKVIETKLIYQRKLTIKRKIRRSYKSLIPKRPKRIKKKERSIPESFFSRFYVDIEGKVLYKKTVTFYPRLTVDFEKENALFMKLREDIKLQEKHKMRNIRLGYQKTNRLLSHRPFFFGRVYMTHRRRNTFITISNAIENPDILDETVAFKSSCGLESYIGPKRSTFHARLSVAKAASTYLTNNEYTSIDLVFPTGLGRIFNRLIRTIRENHMIIRYIVIPKRRGHGIARKKKLRRL